MSENLVLAVQNAPVLRALADGHPNPAVLARAIGRDPDNLRKTLKLLSGAGWATAGGMDLTPEGAALLPRLAALEGGGEPATLTHAQIAASPLNPRKDWTSDDAVDALDALRESILQEGLVQPIAVRREPVSGQGANAVRILLAGERRWRAIGRAIDDGDLPPDHPIPVVLRDADDAADRRLALIENLVRHDLHPLDEAEAFRALREDMPVADLADLAKRTPRHIQQRIALLGLEPETQDRMRLPADDPQHLTVTGARLLLQGHGETGAAVSPTGPLADEDPFGDRAWLAGSKPTAAKPMDTAQTDIEDLTRGRDGRSFPNPAPHERVMLVELAFRRASEGWSDGSRHVPCAEPFHGSTGGRRLAQALVNMFGGGFVYQLGGQAAILGGRARAWLEAEGILPEGDDAAVILHSVRCDALGAPLADQLQARGGYATSWLNFSEADQAAVQKAADAEAARQSQVARQREAQAAHDARRAAKLGAIAEDLRGFHAGAAAMIGGGRNRAFAELAARALGRGPYRAAEGYDDLVFASMDEAITGWDEDGDSDPLNRDLIAIALNLACGVPPEQWPPLTIGEAADDEDAADQEEEA